MRFSRWFENQGLKLCPGAQGRSRTDLFVNRKKQSPRQRHPREGGSARKHSRWGDWGSTAARGNADVRLVLVIAGEDLDLRLADLAGEVVDRHPPRRRALSTPARWARAGLPELRVVELRLRRRLHVHLHALGRLGRGLCRGALLRLQQLRLGLQRFMDPPDPCVLAGTATTIDRSHSPVGGPLMAGHGHDHMRAGGPPSGRGTADRPGSAECRAVDISAGCVRGHEQ